MIGNSLYQLFHVYVLARSKVVAHAELSFYSAISFVKAGGQNKLKEPFLA